jgi:hypothetical protein
LAYATYAAASIGSITWIRFLAKPGVIIRRQGEVNENCNQAEVCACTFLSIENASEK